MKTVIKNVLSVVLICVTALVLVSCGNQSVAKDETTANTTAATTVVGTGAADSTTTTEATGSKTLVAYFSATGTTKTIAGFIQTVTEGDIYEITPEQIYTSDDLNYSNSSSRSTKEQNDKSTRPAISGTVSNWDDYDIVFIGYPIWWGEEPRIIDTFVESYNFDGKTVVPFCTSSSSGVGSSDKNIQNLGKGNATWLSGKRIASSITHKEMCDWVNGLSLGYNAQ